MGIPACLPNSVGRPVDFRKYDDSVLSHSRHDDEDTKVERIHRVPSGLLCTS